MMCAFCAFTDPFIQRRADYVINGQAVCAEHVDEVPQPEGNEFFRTKVRLHLEHDREEREKHT